MYSLLYIKLFRFADRCVSVLLCVGNGGAAKIRAFTQNAEDGDYGDYDILISTDHLLSDSILQHDTAVELGRECEFS